MRRKLLTVSCFLAFTLSSTLWGQAASGKLTGRITNAAGTGVANAAITVTNTGTNASQKGLSGPDGSFTIPGLEPGTYRVEVETAGFKRTSQPNVQLVAGSPAALNITLEAGSTNETVEIKGTSPTVQADNGQVSMGLDSRTVRELPVIDRNHDQLNGLSTGTTPPQPALSIVRDPARNRFFSTNGQSPAANMQYMDGVNNHEPYRGTSVRVQPSETVQAMNVVTGNYMVDRGFTGGTWQNHVTRGGTNDWHGSLFEFHSDNNLRARNFFNIPGNSDPKFVYNQFGGTVGGHIIPNKTFFFGSYEGTYQRGANTTVSTVPVRSVLGGDFSGVPGLQLFNPVSGFISGTGRTPFAGNIIPGRFINPTAAVLASYIPAPNQPGFVNNYVSNVPFQNDGNKFDGRIDQHFNDRNALFLRYGYTNYLAAENSPLGAVIGAASRDRLLAHTATANFTRNMNSIVAEFRVGYNRYFQKLRPQNDQFQLGNQFGSGFNNNLIGINVQGLAPIGSPANLPMNGVDNNYSAVTSWAWHSGMHNVKWGAEVRRFQSDGFTDALFGPNGTALFGPGPTMLAGGAAMSQYGSFYNSFASFLLGAPAQVGINTFTETPSYRQWQSAGWIGDTVQIMRRLTLDLGLRYEVYSPLEPRRSGGAQFFDPAANTFNYAGIGGIGKHAYRYDLNNLAPRFGMALRLTDKTVVRGGYAISYFQAPYQFSGLMPSAYGTVSGTQGTYSVAPFAGQFGPTVISTATAPSSLQNGAPAGNQSVTVVPRDMQTPYVQTFSLGVQQDFYGGTMLGVSYLGTLGRHLPGITELNAAQPGTGVSGLPFANLNRTGSVLSYDNFLTNNYNSLQVNLTKRFAQGLSFTAAYTFSKALGYTSENGRVLNPFNRAANYGPLDYDRQHVLTIGHLWQLPFGAGTDHLNHGWVSQIVGNWQLNGIFTWDSGTPLTITADPLACACPGNTVLANYSGSQGTAGRGLNYLNPAAFSAPASGQFGTLGRGAFRAPGYRNYDLSLFRSFPVRQFKLEFRGEAYNLTNSPRFMSPVTNVNSADFGQITSTVNGAFGRQVNLGVRLLF